MVSSQDDKLYREGNSRSVGDAMSEVSESRRWKEPYGLLSSSSHMVSGLVAVAGESNSPEDETVSASVLDVEVSKAGCRVAPKCYSLGIVVVVVRLLLLLLSSSRCSGWLGR